MALEVTHNTKTGEFKVSYTKHVLNVIGVGLVLSGFASMSSPWWLGIAVGLLESANLSVNEDYQWIISFSQIVIGIGFLIYKYYFLDKWIRQKELDKSTISGANLDIESLMDYFSNLVVDHSYYSIKDTLFYDSYTHFRKPQNNFQFSKTSITYQNYSVTAEKLHNFIVMNFFVYPKSQIGTSNLRFCMAPNLNEDRDGDPSIDNSKRYSELTEQLHRLQKDAKEKFSDFISHLKEVGHL